MGGRLVQTGDSNTESRQGEASGIYTNTAAPQRLIKEWKRGQELILDTGCLPLRRVSDARNTPTKTGMRSRTGALRWKEQERAKEKEGNGRGRREGFVCVCMCVRERTCDVVRSVPYTELVLGPSRPVITFLWYKF